MKMNYDKLISAYHKKILICGGKYRLLKFSDSLNVNNKKQWVMHLTTNLGIQWQNKWKKNICMKGEETKI